MILYVSRIDGNMIYDATFVNDTVYAYMSQYYNLFITRGNTTVREVILDIQLNPYKIITSHNEYEIRLRPDATEYTRNVEFPEYMVQLKRAVRGSRRSEEIMANPQGGFRDLGNPVLW